MPSKERQLKKELKELTNKEKSARNWREKQAIRNRRQAIAVEIRILQGKEEGPREPEPEEDAEVDKDAGADAEV